MLRFLKYFIKLFLFWLLFFAITRFVFLAYYYKKLSNIDFLTIVKSFWHALYLDISTACYFMTVPFLFLLIQSIFKVNFLNVFNKIYFAFFILLVSIITASEIALYSEWGVKLNYKALSHLEHPGEVFSSASITHILSFSILLILLFASGFSIYVKFFHENIVKNKIKLLPNILFSALFLVLMPPLLVVGMRGGLQAIAINLSSAYYSKHKLLNDAAVNSTWNMAQSIDENFNNLNVNPYNYYDLQFSKDVVDSLHNFPKDTTVHFLTSDRPNVVLIILESWSADVIPSITGDTIEVTPQFESLIKEGLLFTNIYANGWTSDMNIPAILSSFPCQPITSIITQPAKYKDLPCLNQKFLQNGYTTSFYFGGQLIYGNIKSYLYYNQFDRIIEEKDFDNNIPRGRLGVHDEFLFRQHIAAMKKETTPFFSVIFTLSSHSPYDMPMKKIIKAGGSENPYLNSVYYTDRSLGEYFDHAREQDWFDNTLFIITSDHSHTTHKQWHVFSREYHRIPLLFYGNVIKKEFRGTQHHKLASHVDLGATLLEQLGIEHAAFTWSKDMMNPDSPEFVFYAFSDGFGWIRPNGYFAYGSSHKKNYFESFNSEQIKIQLQKEGKSYMQTVFQQYLEH